MSALLEAWHLRKVYGGATVAVDDFSFAASAEEPGFVTIAGESGSGKTTIARMLLGIAAPTAGEVSYEGTPLGQLRGEARRRFRRDVQAIFQDPFEVYNPFYHIDHLIITPLRKFGLAHTREEAYDQATAALEAVGLHPGETLGRYPHQLSGGQRQRITIARALSLKPRLIIADEPVSMVDASLRATILESLYHLHRDYRIGFVYITHDLTTAYQVSDRIIILYRGAVVEIGPVEAVVGEPHHPYTRALVASIPRPQPGGDWLTEPVNLRDPDTPSALPRQGCPYAGLCPDVTHACRQQMPAMRDLGEGRAAACTLYGDRPPLAPSPATTGGL